MSPLALFVGISGLLIICFIPFLLFFKLKGDEAVINRKSKIANKSENLDLKETIKQYTETQDPDGDMFYLFDGKMHTIKNKKK